MAAGAVVMVGLAVVLVWRALSTPPPLAASSSWWLVGTLFGAGGVVGVVGAAAPKATTRKQAMKRDFKFVSPLSTCNRIAIFFCVIDRHCRSARSCQMDPNFPRAKTPENETLKDAKVNRGDIVC